MENRPAPALREEVLSLTIKPVEFKGSSPVEEGSAATAGQDILKHPRRFQALATPGAAKPAPPAEEKAETLAEPDIPKRPRRFQALAEAGPAKVVNRFSRRERTAESAAEPSAPEPSAETGPLGPQIQLPASVLTALARAAAAPVSALPLPAAIVDGTARRSKELRGVPAVFQERRNDRTIYDW